LSRTSKALSEAGTRHRSFFFFVNQIGLRLGAFLMVKFFGIVVWGAERALEELTTCLLRFSFVLSYLRSRAPAKPFSCKRLTSF
jgi:hypothetical protein